MLPILIPVCNGNPANALQELNELHLGMLSKITAFIYDSHFWEAIGYFENELGYEGHLCSEYVVCFAQLEVILVDCLLTLVELMKSEDVCGKNVIDVEGPEIARSEIMPRRVHLPLGQDVFF